MTAIAESVWPAPAKLNLFLHVTGRRADGYHELQTLFQLLDWSDELEFRVTRSGEIRRACGEYGVAESDDLVVRAARLLRNAAGGRRGIEIAVRKHIPLGGGLGGGSSDAATTLLALNRLWGIDMDHRELAALGLKLGADVPLFVHGHSALAEGVGERLDPVNLGERHYVVVLGAEAVSTAAAFADPLLDRAMPRLDRAAALAGAGRNAFESVVASRYPAIARTLEDLRTIGQPRLTGTGSAIFLERPDQEAAERTAQDLKCRYNVRAVRGIDRSPVLDKLSGA